MILSHAGSHMGPPSSARFTSMGVGGAGFIAGACAGADDAPFCCGGSSCLLQPLNINININARAKTPANVLCRYGESIHTPQRALVSVVGRFAQPTRAPR